MTAPITSPIPVRIYDTGMVLRGVVDDYQIFEWTHNWYTADEWTMTINRYKTNVGALRQSRYIGFLRPGWTVAKIGKIEKMEKPLDKDGKGSENWIISGRGVEGCFDRLLLAGTNLLDGYDTQTGVAAETAWRHYIDRNCITALDPEGVSDPSRNISGLSLSTQAALGGMVDYQGRLQPINTMTEDLSRASLISFKFPWTGSGQNFVGTGYAGTDRSATIVISPEFGNVQTLRYLNSLRDSRNVLYICGTAGIDGGSA